MSYQTRVEYIVANGQREFDLLVPYLDPSHIKVGVNGATPPFEWITASRIRLTFQAPDGSAVVISRVTPIADALVTFQNGSNLTQEELNRAVLQLLYKAQETDDLYYGSLDRARVRLGDHLGIVTSPEAIADELLRISEMGDDLLNRFRDALAGVDLNAQQIIGQAFRLDNLTDIVDALGNLETGGIATLIQNETDQRVEGDTALASTLALIGAKNAANTGFILDTNKVSVSPTQTLAQAFSAIYAAGEDTLALIQDEQTARTTATDALAASLVTLGARLADNEAAIAEEAIARATADEAEALARQSLAVSVGENTSAIQTEATARATAISALAQTLAILGVANGANTAFIMDLNKVQIGGGVSMGSRLSGIDTKAGNAAAAVVAETTARVNGDNALSQSLATVTNTVGNHTTSITTLLQVTNGLNAKWGVSVNNNGYITGLLLNSGALSSSFAVMADVFTIVGSGGNPIQPFYYDAVNGVLNIQSAKFTGSINVNNRFIVDAAGNTTIRSATTGARLTLTNALLTVHDSNNTLRVRLGVW